MPFFSIITSVFAQKNAVKTEKKYLSGIDKDQRIH